jgi:hypothetical protein
MRNLTCTFGFMCPRRCRPALAGASILLAFSVATTGNAHAQSRARDYFLDAPRKGLYLHLDAFTIGVQASLEHRVELNSDLTMLTSRVSVLASTGFAEASAQTELRVAFVALALAGGYRNVWRTYQGTEGQSVTYTQRRQLDKTSAFTRESWPWVEGRMRVILPLDPLWLVTSFTARYETSPANTYDWFHANVHDGGFLAKAEATLFWRHSRYGAIGPTVRYMNMPRGADRVNEVAFGFTAATRVGLKKKTDLLSLQLLAQPFSNEFGFHALNSPLWVMLIYRHTTPLAGFAEAPDH